VGETGYAPRVLVFNLQDASSDTPLVSISEHTFGVNAVAWSPDTKYLASLGAANDGFLYLWRVDPRTGALKLFQQNKCTSFVKGMVWMGSNLLTLGVRHVKVWRVDDGPEISGARQKTANDGPVPAAPVQAQKPLPGRNILLGSMLDATFSCALPISDDRAVLCTETGSVCLLDDTNKQMKLTKALDLGFSVTCISRRGDNVYIGGKEDHFAIISLDAIFTGKPEIPIHTSQTAAGLIAMGFLAENLVTVDSKRSIGIWSADQMPSCAREGDSHIPIPGLGEPIVGIQRLSASNKYGASFFTWSGPGKVTLWDMDGMIKSSFDIPIEQIEAGTEAEPVNQVVTARASNDASLFAAGDKLGVLRIVEVSSGECLLESKVHASNCQDITVHEGKSRFVVASCGRDRTVQLFHRPSTGVFEHFQTLEFSAKVVQVLIPTEDKVLTCSLDRTLQIHDLVSKEGQPDVVAAVPSRHISLRASPSSMTVTPDIKTIFVSLLDRSVCQFDFASGRLSTSFKCNDEAGLDSVVLESLTYGELGPDDLTFLLGISNTDKSVRIYDTQSGCFMDREWGHTEAINGVIFIDNEEAGRKVVSAGEDGTIMIWALDFQGSLGGSRSRDPSPEKAPPQSTSTRPPLRRVLSKAELAEFQRPSPTTTTGRRSPRASRLTSKFHLPFSSLRTPTADKQQTSPTSPSAAMNDTPNRRDSSGGSDDSPPPSSPKARSKLYRRPSLPALGSTPSSSIKARKASNSNHPRGSGSGGGGAYGFGSLSMATEQTCRQLRAYRKKLSSTESINSDVLAQLDAELRLTAAALGERAIRSRTNAAAASNRCHKDRDQDGGGGSGGGGNAQELSESLLSGLLDQYSERLVSMLDEKLRLRLAEEEKDDATKERRPSTAEGGSSSTTRRSSEGGSLGSGGGVVCEEPQSM
jgi:WD40 repeat protein